MALTARKISLRLLFLTLLVAIPAASAFAANLVPKKARAKIDKVEVDKAPYLRLFTTFLNSRGLPVSPEAIERADITCDEVPVDTDVEITTFGDQEDEFMEIAVVIPVSNRFSEKEQEQIKAGVAEIVGQTREADRVVAFFDRGDGIGPPGATLGDGATAADNIGNATAQGNGAFLYSGLKKAVKVLVDEGEEDRKRVVIMVTDGFDSEIISPDTVSVELRDIYKKAKKNNIKIFIIMYKPLIEDIVPLFEGLSRRTGATYREAITPSDIVKNVKYAYGEVYGQLVLDYKMKVKVGDSCTFQVTLVRKGSGKEITTKPFSEVEFTVVNTDWLAIALIAGIILGALILLLVIFLIVRRVRRKKKAAKEREERADGQAAEAGAEGAADGANGAADPNADPKAEEAAPAPPPKRRGMGAPGGLYKPRGGGAGGGGGGGGGAPAGAAGGGAAAAGGGAAAAGAAGASKRSRRKKKGGGKPCDNCGREMMPNWTECLFCKAGIGGSAGK